MSTAGEQVAVLLLRASWSALHDQDRPNDLWLANQLLEELDLDGAHDAIGLLTRAFIITAEQAPDLDVDRLLELLGLSVARAAVGP